MSGAWEITLVLSRIGKPNAKHFARAWGRTHREAARAVYRDYLQSGRAGHPIGYTAKAIGK